jgi:riboflavin synthase
VLVGRLLKRKQGHVDGTAVISKLEKDGDSLRVTFRPNDESLLVYLIPKGFVAIDGTSLTLTMVDETSKTFGVMLIQHTQEKITLSRKKVGDKVNIEVDMVGKYVAKSVSAGVEAMVRRIVAEMK